MLYILIALLIICILIIFHYRKTNALLRTQVKNRYELYSLPFTIPDGDKLKNIRIFWAEANVEGDNSERANQTLQKMLELGSITMQNYLDRLHKFRELGEKAGFHHLHFITD